MTDTACVPFGDIDPPRRLLMGPGPINVHPRVLRAMSADLVGQFDPSFTAYMNETMALYRRVFQTGNRWTFVIDGTARAAIECAFVSVIEPGDCVVVANIGRFGSLLEEIAERCGASVVSLKAAWGTVLDPAVIADALKTYRPRLFAAVHGDTSTTLAQPLDGVGAACRDVGALMFVDATATLAGVDVPVDHWQADIVTAGLQKCLAGPSGSAPITLSDRAVEHIMSRRHVERGIAGPDAPPPNGLRIASNYFDLAMLIDYWSEQRLNHHTEAATMLYAARECARLVVEEGLPARLARHKTGGAAMAAGLTAMGLSLYGDQRHRMDNIVGIYIPDGVAGERVRQRMLNDFSIEIGTSFGPLHGRIWRIGVMGYNCSRSAILVTLAALEQVLLLEGLTIPHGAAVAAALARLDGPAGA